MDLEDLNISFELLEGLEHECAILLIDALPGRRRQTKQAIEQDPRFTVTGVEKGMEALEIVDEGEFELVVVTPELEDELSAFELARLIRTSPKHRLIPVMFYVEGEKDEELLEKAFDAGVFDVLFTPTTQKELSTRIENMTRINWLQERLSEVVDQLKQIARYDELTEVADRRHFMDNFETEVERAQRYEDRLGVLYFDLDHFKDINDEHGHTAGDAVLRHVGELLRDNFRKVDLIGRVGGEEFVVLLPETDLEGAEVAAERFRELLDTKPPEFEGEQLPVTVSGGVISRVPGEGDTVTSLMMEADGLLYQAKADGRNTLVTQEAAVPGE